MNEELMQLFEKAKSKLLSSRGRDGMLNHWMYITEVEKGRLVVDDHVTKYICYGSFRYNSDHYRHAFMVSDVKCQHVDHHPKVLDVYYEKVVKDSIFSKFITHYEDGIVMIDLGKWGASQVIGTLIALRQATEFTSAKTYFHLMKTIGMNSDVAMCLSWLFMYDGTTLSAYGSGAHGVTEPSRFRIQNLATFIDRADTWAERSVRDKGGSFTVHDYVSQNNDRGPLLSAHMNDLCATKGEGWAAVTLWDVEKFLQEAVRLGNKFTSGRNVET